MKLPSRLSLALGTLIAGLIAVSGEVSLPHPVHQAIVIVGAFLLFLIHPSEGGVVVQQPAILQSARTPDGAAPAAPETI